MATSFRTISPTWIRCFTANRNWLHLEARFNYENLHTGSLWVGYNFAVGKKLVLDVTPMIGGVFGRTTGIAPGCETSLTYKKVELSISNDMYSIRRISPGISTTLGRNLRTRRSNWFRMGVVAERIKAFHTSLDVQRGFLVGVSHKKWEFTTYVFNAGFTDPTVVLEVGVSF